MFISPTEIQDVAHTHQRDSQPPGEVRTAISIGGGHSGSRLAECFADLDAFIDVDVSKQLERHRNGVSGILNRIPVPLGQGMTALSLAAYGSPELEAAMRTVGAMSGEEGLGAQAGPGYLAVLQAMKLPTHAALRSHLSTLISAKTGGRPTRQYNRTVLGAGGGTGGAAPVLLTRSLLEPAARRIPTFSEYDVILSEAFVEFGERVHRNAAAALWRLIRDLIRLRRTDLPLLVESLRLLNYAPFGSHNDIHDTEVGLDEQSLDASALKAYRAMVAPNNALRGLYGVITIWQRDRWKLLDPQSEVAPQVAEIYFAAIQAGSAASQAVISRVPAVVVKVSSRPCRRDSIESILATDLNFDERLSALRAPKEAITLKLTAQTEDDEEFRIETLKSDFAAEPGSLSEAVDRIQLLGSIVLRLDHDLKILANEIGVLLGELANEESFLDSAYEERCSISLMRPLESLKTLFKGSPSEEQVFEAAERFRSFSDELHSKESLKRALELARLEVIAEQRIRIRRLSELAEVLDQHRPRGRHASKLPSTVSARSTNAEFTKLLRLPELDFDQQRAQLARLAGSVTIEGLAKIVGCESRVRTIAECIVSGTNVIEGPQLGGQVRPRSGDEVIVLPPLPDSYRNDLVKTLKALSKNVIVAVCDSGAAGLTVTRYTVSTASTLRELFPGRMWDDLKAAYNDPRRVLFFPDGCDGLADDLAEGESESERRERLDAEERAKGGA